MQSNTIRQANRAHRRASRAAKHEALREARRLDSNGGPMRFAAVMREVHRKARVVKASR